MAYLETFLDGLVTKLEQRGIATVVEYPNHPLQQEREWQRLTISILETNYAPALLFHGGNALPLTLKLRMRLLQHPKTSIQSLPSIFQALIFPTLLQGGYNIREVTLHTPYFDRTLGRMVQEAECVMNGYLARIPFSSLQEGGNDDGTP